MAINSILSLGAIHQARFMASCIFYLKMSLMEQELMTKRQSNEIEMLAEFIALLYGPYFLTTQLGVAAPRVDRDFIQQLIEYQVQLLITNMY